MFGWKSSQNKQDEQTERQRLSCLNEKELLVEVILELRKLGRKCDDIGRKIVIWSN